MPDPLEWAVVRLAELGADEYRRRNGCRVHPAILDELARRREALRGVPPPLLRSVDDVPAELIGTAEAARLLGTSERTVRNMIRDGRLWSTRVGKLWRLDADEVHRLAAVSGSVAEGPMAS